MKYFGKRANSNDSVKKSLPSFTSTLPGVRKPCFTPSSSSVMAGKSHTEEFMLDEDCIPLPEVPAPTSPPRAMRRTSALVLVNVVMTMVPKWLS